MASSYAPSTPNDSWRAEDGSRAPYQPMLQELGAELLRYAADQLERTCNSAEQGATMLRDMAWAYEPERRHR